MESLCSHITRSIVVDSLIISHHKYQIDTSRTIMRHATASMRHTTVLFASTMTPTCCSFPNRFRINPVQILSMSEQARCERLPTSGLSYALPLQQYLSYEMRVPVLRVWFQVLSETQARQYMTNHSPFFLYSDSYLLLISKSFFHRPSSNFEHK